MRTVPVVAVLGIALLAASTGGVSQVEPPDEGTVLGSPSLSVAAQDNSFEWGDRRDLAVTIANAGDLVRGGPERFEDRVTTARSVEVSVATDRLPPALAGRLQVESGRVLLGELPEGGARTVNLSVGVSQSIPPGTYQLPVRISYEYTSFVRYGPNEPQYNDADREVVERVTIVVVDRPRLSLSAVQSTDVEPGTTGTFRFTVANTGTRVARDVGLTLATDGTAVGFGAESIRRSTVGVFVGDLEPGESATVTVTASAAEATAPGTYLVETTARYTTGGGFQRVQTDLRSGLRVVDPNATTLDERLPGDRPWVDGGRSVTTLETNVANRRLLSIPPGSPLSERAIGRATGPSTSPRLLTPPSRLPTHGRPYFVVDGR
ncbi:COG1361 S-layer family protein [Halorubellus salinus]|uniref:COG1361 S-layer family protein n=1 Tax=Halorubellus salinus TaxID=755309 RepID=UPI001D0633B0|nr:CARDB domain-containing protein [Halorubellus salinus]